LSAINREREETEAKEKYDSINQFLRSKGLDPKEYRVCYELVTQTDNNPVRRSAVPERFYNYHDYLKRLQSLTDEEKTLLNTKWEFNFDKWNWQEGGEKQNPDAFIATRNDLTDMTSLDSKLYPYREELQKIIVAQRDGRTPDLYAEAVSERKEEPAADSSEKKWIRMTPAVEKIQKERQKGKLG